LERWCISSLLKKMLDFVLLYFFIIIIWSTVFYLYRYSLRKDESAPIDDIGVFWTATLALYTTLPVFSWILQGYTYISPLNPRLVEYQPSIQDVNYLLLITVSYSVGFVLFFSFFRRKISKLEIGSFKQINSTIVLVSLGILLFTKLVLLSTVFLFGIESAESYIDQYRVILEAPLFVRQILKYLLAFQSLAIIIILISIFQNWKKRKIYFIFFLLFTLFSFDPEGGRASIATTILALLFLWHVLMNKIASRIWISISIIGLILFLVLGLFRGVENLADYNFTGEDNPGVGEFDAIWSNAVHLNAEKKMRNINLPFTVRYGEFWEFVPSQILPFNKTSFSIWYLDTYYSEYKELGGGWAFGALSQAVIGFGPIEGFVRGGVLGALYGFLMFWYRKSKHLWWSLPFYLTIYLFSFMSIRDTTFTQLSTIIQNTLPSLCIIFILSISIKNNRKVVRTK
jgi:oligosaccharide repeat unit polymerase